ncbi:MAG: GlsB/YeaQ/YmgE family stress response membrane protein [Devosia sp.]|nr:GlsB/YeaQ/YmgE family stress response membrane protein [Devosia sp.]
MTGQALIVWVLVGLAAGWVASRVVGGSGLVRYLIAGLLGSIVGGIIVSYFNIPIPVDNEWIRAFLVATGGAIVVILVARLIN